MVPDLSRAPSRIDADKQQTRAARADHVFQAARRGRGHGSNGRGNPVGDRGLTAEDLARTRGARRSCSSAGTRPGDARAEKEKGPSWALFLVYGSVGLVAAALATTAALATSTAGATIASRAGRTTSRTGRATGRAGRATSRASRVTRAAASATGRAAASARVTTGAARRAATSAARRAATS